MHRALSRRAPSKPRGWGGFGVCPTLLFLAASLLLQGVLPVDARAQEMGDAAVIPGGSSHREAGTVDEVIPPSVERAEVTLDGSLGEPEWADAWTITEFHQLSPREGEPPGRPTEARIFYDREALYVGIRVREDPAEIVERELERNAFHRSDQDGVAVVLDTNGDGRTAYGFVVTPSGARTDMAVSDERFVTWNEDWDAFWDAETARDEAGWTAEFRIPFSSLRFEPGPGGDVTMGLTVWRYRARSNEYIVFPRIPNDWSNAQYKPSRAHPVRFQGVEAGNPVYVKPYVLGGTGHRSRLGEGGERYLREGRTEYEIGGDLQYNVTNNLVLDVTVNTDFAQVEADDVNFNLDRFSLFFPEKRDFFQERSDLFDFSLPGGRDLLFHSRRIGIVDGEQTPILGGLRLSGSHAGWNLGLLSMQTGSATVAGRNVPSENVGVVRVQRPVRDRGSYVGALFTSRTDLDGNHNFLMGADTELHLRGDLFMEVMAAQTVEAERDPLESNMLSVGLQRRIERGFFFGGSVRHLGPELEPGVGFLRRVGYNRYGSRGGYAWDPAGNGSVRRYNVGQRTELIWDHRFDALESSDLGAWWGADFHNGASLEVQAGRVGELLQRGFQVGRLEVPPGRYRYLEGSLSFGSPAGRDFRVQGEVGGGGYFGGNRIGLSGDLAWTPSPHFSLGVEQIYNRIRLPDGRDQVLLSRIRLGGAVTRNLTASAFVQHDSSRETLVPNIRIRYNPTEGSDLFLVYNEEINTALDPLDPRSPLLPRSQARSFQVKYTYTFVR